MAKDPAFLFYPSDFLTGTMFMNNEQIGIYIKLLCSQHQHGGIIDKISFNSLVGENIIVKSKFIESENGFYNERLTLEMEKRNKKSNNMSETAKEVWKNRKIQMYNKSKENEYNCINKVNKKHTNVIQAVNVNEDINIDKYKEERKFNFSNYSDEIKTKLKKYKITEPVIFIGKTIPVIYYDLSEILVNAISDIEWQNDLVNRFGVLKFERSLIDFFLTIKANSEYTNYKGENDFKRHYTNWLNLKINNYR